MERDTWDRRPTDGRTGTGERNTELSRPRVEPANVREATLDDAAAVADIARGSWHAAYDDLLSPSVVDETVDAWYDPADLRDQLDRNRIGGVYVAEIEGELTGFAHVYDGDDERIGRGENELGGANAPAELELGRLYVREAYWGRGVGTALVERAAAELAAEGVERLRAVVFADNEVGRAFYDARGFEVRGERTEKFAGDAYDELVVVAAVDDLRAE
ncbi:GNAT family N-acetyltransferase [Haloprofundus salilacus]|uniref:GNAT family N-acetyltransferase n=1 Tax=Haloprofundus salilacus TaxID=2876190 RepID=UPI001CCC3514|nr:GNAT family N-acetyltransferase [Haloprofundus salilacus]